MAGRKRASTYTGTIITNMPGIMTTYTIMTTSMTTGMVTIMITMMNMITAMAMIMNTTIMTMNTVMGIITITYTGIWLILRQSYRTWIFPELYVKI